ncbi:Arylsulfatase J, partial [Pseudolycoriella hygida]
VSILDDGVGRVVKALSENKMLDNTIILFFADNGAPIEIEHRNAGSNMPFKGQKESPWEGAMRSAAVIWSSLLKNRERTSNQLFHISDWLPTFAALAGVTVDQPIDGKNIWEALSCNVKNPRDDALLHLEYADGLQSYLHDFGYQSYIRGAYKYINGTTYNGTYDYWMDYVDKSEKHPSFERYEKRFQCFPMENPCLYNIVEDPCERKNIASLQPFTLRMMEDEVIKMGMKAPAVRNKPGEERSNPSFFNRTWTWWYDELGIPDFPENLIRCKRQKSKFDSFSF